MLGGGGDQPEARRPRPGVEQWTDPAGYRRSRAHGKPLWPEWPLPGAGHSVLAPAVGDRLSAVRSLSDYGLMLIARMRTNVLSDSFSIKEKWPLSRKETVMVNAPAVAEFTGFTTDAFGFFRELATNNNRDWFQAHKELFERACREPFKALTIALDPPVGAERLTRIYRDVRFSKDKSPYHTHISAVVRGNYVHLSADGLYVGTGLYMPEPAVLRRFREAIDNDVSGRQLHDILTSLRERRYTVGTHESVASVPRGFSADHPRLDLLRMKDIHAGKTFKPELLSTADAVDLVQQVCSDVAALQHWLVRHVGPMSSH